MSIATQRNIDNVGLKVYIVNDCDGTDYTFMLDYYRQWLDITYLTLPENVGCGLARQYGIDHSTQEWITFIDSDDVFSSPYSIAYLYDEANKMECDVLVSNYYQEYDNGNALKELKNDVTRMHGKVFNRAYLNEKNIRFHKELRLNEDGHFNTLAVKLAKTVGYFQFFSYIWCENKNSLTRTGDYLNAYSYMYTQGMADAFEILINNNIPNLDSYTRNILANIYYYKVNVTNSQFKGKNEEIKYDYYARKFLSLIDVDDVVYKHKDEMMKALQFMVDHMFSEVTGVKYKPEWQPFADFIEVYR
jgi:glycosyltransferase involved in cell wall biosynthesis